MCYRLLINLHMWVLFCWVGKVRAICFPHTRSYLIRSCFLYFLCYLLPQKSRDCDTDCIDNTVFIITAALPSVKLRQCQNAPSWNIDSNKQSTTIRISVVIIINMEDSLYLLSYVCSSQTADLKTVFIFGNMVFHFCCVVNFACY